ncbi:MAG TPA: FAD-dependent oxidoreductase [Luteimonas sp.]|nr:FAD-dependent oxidoreductase [Luteimonas sp.]
MSRRGLLDVAVVGGGVVGAACALALSRLDLHVALVERAPPPAWTPARHDLRVYAFAPDNAALLATLGVWQPVLEAGGGRHVQAYRRMRVWDAGGGGELVFDADAVGARELGWIVEHALLADRLWQALQAGGVDLRTPGEVVAVAQTAEAVELRLADGGRMQARIAVAADGAASGLRRLAGLDVSRHDYHQAGVVAYVETTSPHQDTAWQRFLPSGPLAFLPCADGGSSIVWTLPDDEARAVAALDDAAFGAALTRASDGRLGTCTPSSPRVLFPLQRQLASGYRAGRVLVLGDAAHVVHPLAGQGVNLGLRDVAALHATVAAARQRGVPWDAPDRLARWARTRRSENALAAHAFEAINRVFSNEGLATTLLRGPLLGLAGRLSPLAAGLWRRAAGI